MAEVNVPQGVARKQVCDKATQTLREVDELVQRATESIRALALGAQKLLEMDVNSLVAAANLLNQIHYLAEGVSDDVTLEAEKHGASSYDEHHNDLWLKLRGQEDARHAAKIAGVAHV